MHPEADLSTANGLFIFFHVKENEPIRLRHSAMPDKKKTPV